MSLSLAGKISLVTGSSRGVGAATALKLAELGSDVVLHFRSKAPRAEEVAKQIRALGREVLAIQADLTVESDLSRMIASVQQHFARLDILILNASGGLEKGKTEDYAMALNSTAQLRIAELASRLMRPGGRIVFVTSHWAHFYETTPVIPGYEVVARSKHAGEKSLKEYAPELSKRDISLLIVSGDAIEGTITPRLLERQNPGLLEGRRSAVQTLPTVDQFAEVIAQTAADAALPTGHTVLVGSTSY